MLQALLQEELHELQAKDLYRKLRALEPLSSTRALFEGKEITLFCGNDYLDLSHHPRVLEAARQGIKRYGIGAGAARLISGTTDAHTRLEEKIAAFKRKESALVFSAGYLANIGTLSALAGKKDLILMDKLSHASLIDGAHLSGAALRVFPHKNYERCGEILEKSKGFEKVILVSDTVFSMDGDLADLERLIALKEKHTCLLVVDDAHGTGVLGLEGRGAAEDLGVEDRIDVITGTFSKAAGCLGGYAAASGETIQYLVNHARSFIFATALPPLLCEAIAEALDVMIEEPQIRHRLWQNIQKMHGGLAAAGYEMAPISSPIFPVMTGSEKEALRISSKLLESGLLAPAVRYPTVAKGKARLRVTVSSSHNDQDIEKLINFLISYKN